MSTRRLTFATAVVLQAIDVGRGYGFDIMDATGLPSGTVYPALRRLERDGLVASHWEADDIAEDAQRPPRRYYRVAPAGSAALSEARARYHGLQRVVVEDAERR